MLAHPFHDTEPAVPAHASAVLRTFVVAPRGDPRREAIERMVAAVYRERHGARLRAFSPTLVASLIDGRPVAAAGYRRASDALFLERYLDVPVEAAIHSRTGVSIARDAIVEVGHFASTRAGEGRRLMMLLARHLHAGGAQWAVTTATRELRALYSRLGVHAWRLADAKRAAAGDDAGDWGTYYDHAPVVLAGPIARNLERLECATR